MEFKWKKTLTDDYKSSIMIAKSFSLEDIFVIVVYFLLMFVFRFFVAEEIRTFYYIFNVMVGAFLTVKSADNPQKRIYESYFLFIRKKIDNNIFRSIQTKLGRHKLFIYGESISEQYRHLLDEMEEKYNEKKD